MLILSLRLLNFSIYGLFNSSFCKLLSLSSTSEYCILQDYLIKIDEHQDQPWQVHGQPGSMNGYQEPCVPHQLRDTWCRWPGKCFDWGHWKWPAASSKIHVSLSKHDSSPLAALHLETHKHTEIQYLLAKANSENCNGWKQFYVPTYQYQSTVYGDVCHMCTGVAVRVVGQKAKAKDMWTDLICLFWKTYTHTHTHTHTTVYCSSGIWPGPPGWTGTRKVKPGRLKPIWIYWSKR